MKNYLFLMLMLIYSSGYSYAQSTDPISKSEEYIHSYDSHQVKYDGITKQFSESEIKGSPYLADSFMTGSIYTHNKQQFLNIPVRYNIYTDNIEYILGAGRVLQLEDAESVEKVEFGSYNLIFIPGEKQKSKGSGFFIVLAEGKVSLLSKPGIRLKKPTPPGGYAEQEPPSLVRKPDTFYLKTSNNHILPVQNKKGLISAFPDNKEKMSLYIKKKKIKHLDSESLTELIRYYNSL